MRQVRKSPEFGFVTRPLIPSVCRSAGLLEKFWVGFRKILGKVDRVTEESRFDLGVNWIGIESRPALDSENFYAALTATFT